MPKAIAVTQRECDFVRSALSRKFDLSIHDTNDCRRLSELIEKITGVPISYNTLRRFFQIVPSPSSCSLFSLNLIARTLEFSNWESLKGHIRDYEVSYQNHLLQMFRRQGRIDHEMAFGLVTKMPFTDWKEGYWLKLLIQLALEFEDDAFLEKLFFVELPVFEADAIDKLYFAFQEIHARLVSNIQLRHLVIEHMGGSENIQQIIMMCYVDENGMDAYYGELLEEFKEVFSRDPQQLLFYRLMQLQSLYNKKGTARQLQKQYDMAFDLFEKCDRQKLVTIVKGRLAAWRWILFQDDDLFLELLDLKDSKINVGHYVDFFNRLTILHEQPYFKLVENKKLLHLFRNEKAVLSFFNEGINNQVKLGFAINYFLQKDMASAREWFQMSSSFVFDITMFDWYHKWYTILDNRLKSLGGVSGRQIPAKKAGRHAG